MTRARSPVGNAKQPDPEARPRRPRSVERAAPNEQDVDAGAVGRVLRIARARRGWSIREVSRRTGFPNTYLSQVERGVIRRPDPGVLWELAALYNLDFPLLAQWSGQLGEGLATDQALLSAVLKAFASLDESRRFEALEYMERLANRQTERS